jgi:hypothetical protein
MQLLPFQPTQPDPFAVRALMDGGFAARRVNLKAAREDPAAFAAYVLKDEGTGRPIQLKQFHYDWHDLSDSHRRLVLMAAIECGKTQQLTVARTLFKLGVDPNRRIVIVSGTHTQAQKIASSISGYIESSKELKEVFPHLKPDPKGPWTQSQLTVVRRGHPKDPSVQIGGAPFKIEGARIDDLYLDDIMNFENTRTPRARDELWEWLHSAVIGRLGQDATATLLCNPYHRDDVAHRFEKLRDGFGKRIWHVRKYPILDSSGDSIWPERWPLERVEKVRTELVPSEYARQLLCQPRDDKSARFKWEWIQVALKRGNGKRPTYQLKQVPPGYKTITGVDLAVSEKEDAARTVFFTLALKPDGSKEVLSVEAGRWGGPEILDRLVDVQKRYLSTIFVEANAAQKYIVQMAHERGLSKALVRPFQTGANKLSPQYGVESLAVEMAGGKWIIPNIEENMHPEIAAWVDELLYYDPSPGVHTGDSAMASWIASEGARRSAFTVESGSLGYRMR